MIFENEHTRRLKTLATFGQFVLTLLVEEKEWSEDMQQRIEDGAMDLRLLDTDKKGNYKLIPHE